MRKVLPLLLALYAITSTAHAFNPNVLLIRIKEASNPELSLTSQGYQLGIPELDAILRSPSPIDIRMLNMGKMGGGKIFRIEYAESEDIENTLMLLSKCKDLDYSERNGVGKSGSQRMEASAKTMTLPDDPVFYLQWGLANDGSFSYWPLPEAGADIDMINAWDYSQGDSNLIVAVLGTGTKSDHPEWAGRIWSNSLEIPGNFIDDDSNSYEDDVNGWNWAYNSNNIEDDLGSGTNEMGLLGATGDNGIGIAGMDWNCKMMPLKVLDDAGLGYYDWWAEAIVYATDHGAKVITLPFGGTTYSFTLTTAVNYAWVNNVTMVASMQSENSSDKNYPAGCNHVIAVGSTDPDDERSDPFFWSAASGSNYGTHISVVAPGNYMFGPHYLINSNYTTYWGGTGQSVSLVAGLASLLLAQDSTRTPDQIKALIEAGAEDEVGLPAEDITGFDIYHGHGRINAFNSLSMPVGIREHINESAFSLSPNPAKDFVKLTFPHATDLNYSCRIVNALGKIVWEGAVSPASPVVYLQYPPGFYMVGIESNSQWYFRKLVIN